MQHKKRTLLVAQARVAYQKSLQECFQKHDAVLKAYVDFQREAGNTSNLSNLSEQEAPSNANRTTEELGLARSDMTTLKKEWSEVKTTGMQRIDATEPDRSLARYLLQKVKDVNKHSKGVTPVFKAKNTQWVDTDSSRKLSDSRQKVDDAIEEWDIAIDNFQKESGAYRNTLMVVQGSALTKHEGPLFPPFSEEEVRRQDLYQMLHDEGLTKFDSAKPGTVAKALNEIVDSMVDALMLSSDPKSVFKRDEDTVALWKEAERNPSILKQKMNEAPLEGALTAASVAAASGRVAGLHATVTVEEMHKSQNFPGK